jgi:dihydrofolate reductase
MNQIKPISVHIILAVDESGVLGLKNGKMAWESIPEDFANFKKMTSGKVVIMGRKTWDSLPLKFKPLPDRLMNIVMTRGNNPESSKSINAAGGTVCLSLENLYTICRGQHVEEIWVMGGKEIYEMFLSPDLEPRFCISSIHRTLVKGELACDKLGIALPQEDLQKFVRMPTMINPIISYKYLRFLCSEVQSFSWGKIQVFKKLF